MATAKAQELRRLMKQQKSSKKINHPLAKYLFPDLYGINIYVLGNKVVGCEN